MAYQVNGSRVEWNPTAARLRELTEKMPNASVTEFGNVVVKARVDARSTRSTYLVDDSTNSRGQTITRTEYDRAAALQDAYIAQSHMLVVDGYIGSDPQFRTRARLVMETAHANVAGMQQQLYYPAGPENGPENGTENGAENGTENEDPDTTVIYTPNLEAPGYPDDRLIAVDLNANVTRVLNSDYFGESKKGGLRMWNNIVYHRGGLALHAGCKVIPVPGENKTVLIVGLSGTGKTTTTFTTQLGSKPFFPRDMADMGNRMLELLDSHQMQAFVLNTGRVGGRDDQPDSKKVTIPYSSAIVQGIVEGAIEWAVDPDFGYEVATAVPGVDDPEILQPRLLYARQGRLAEHDAMVTRLRRERQEFLGSLPGLDSSLAKSLGC